MSVELPSSNANLATDADDLESGTETTTLHRTVPISHGAAISMVLDDDNEIYDSCRELWRKLDLEPGEKHYIPADIDYNSGDDFVWVFSSSGWVAGDVNQHGNWKRWYDYGLTLRKAKRHHETGEIIALDELPVSCDVTVEPQKDGMCYDPEKNDGERVEKSLPYGEGTRLKIQTTYVEKPSTIRRRTLEAVNDMLDLLDDSQSVRSEDIKPESQRITKQEAHLRFHIDLKEAAVRTIERSERLVDYGGGSEINTRKNRVKKGWLEALTASDRWDWLGVDPATTTVIEDGEETEKRLKRGLKVYQAGNWHKKPETHWAHHPKIEAFSTGEHNPHISEWHDQLDRLRELVISHAEWAGIEDADLIADPHFDPDTQPVDQFDHPKGRREQLHSFFEQFGGVVYEELGRSQTDAVYDILGYLTERCEQGVTYDELIEVTGYSRSNLNYHIGKLMKSGLIDTRGNPAVIVFSNDIIKDQATDAMDNAATRRGEETMGDRQEAREERAQDRREARENGEANGCDSHPDEDIEDEQRDDNDDTRPFEYLNDHPASLSTILSQYMDDDHPRGDRDIRVRFLEDDDNGLDLDAWTPDDFI